MSGKKGIIGLEEGLSILEEGFTKAKRILEEGPEMRFSSEEYIKFYECVYRMSTQNPGYSKELYGRYKLALEQCVLSMVLPSLMDKHDEVLLQELSKLWFNYKIMVRWLSNFFNYIDRFYTIRSGLPSLDVVALDCFCNLVCPMLKGRLRDAVIYLIDRERTGGQVDIDLLKNVLTFILEANDGIRNLFRKEFEQAILENTCAFYSQKASEWILEFSLPDYLLKVEECLERESERLPKYLICSSELSRRLLQNVKDQMVSACESQLKGKQLDAHLSLQNYLAINQELLPMCASLGLGDDNLGAASCMEMEL